MAVFAQDEEGAEVRAANERAARENKRDEAERPAAKRASGRTNSPDERSQSIGRLSTPAHSNAVPLCPVHSHNNIDRISPGVLSLDAGPFRRGSLSPARIHDGGLDDCSAVDHTGTFGGSASEKNDGDRYAALHVVYPLGSAGGTAYLLAGGKHRWVQSTVHNQPPDQIRR